MYRDEYMQRAIAISRQALDTPGTEPFGSVIVKDGRIVGEGLNHLKAHHDPTSHSEIEAIRDACRRLECVDLAGCELYTSCEPCVMCVSVITNAGISRLYYAADMAQTDAAFSALPPPKIDGAALIAECSAPISRRRIPAEQHRAEDAIAVLEAWAAR
jgi:tRNA(Arg) A34 adenosine deaminase TadA